MSRFLKLAIAYLTLVLSMLASTAIAQDAVPQEILNRTLFINGGRELGTAFTIDYNGKIYLVTARHVVAGLPTGSTTIKIQRSGNWEDYHVVKTLFPRSNDVDIAVLETDEKAAEPFHVAISKTGGPSFGQQVWFLGYPWGIHSRARNGELPFIKRGTMSAIDASNDDAVVLYIDGFNNPGFSGGPIVYWSFSERAYRLLGVVKGYKEDTAKVVINGEHADTQLLVNSGILIGYSIEHATQAIDQEKLQTPSK